MGGTIVTPSDFSILLLAFIPLSLGFAVLTQRLMDIDVVLRRGVVYGLITLAMAVVLTVAFALVLSDGIAPGISQQFLLALLLSGLAVFLLGPTKNLIETLVDRFIYKDRFDYRQTIQVLSSSLSATTDTTVASSLVVDSPVTSMNLAGACLFLASEAGSFELGAARGIFSSTASQRHLLELLLRRNISIEFPKLAETPDPDIAFIIPLVAAGKEVGVLFLSPKLSKQEFTGRDFYFIQGLASVASVSLRGLLIAEADIKTRRHHEKAILEAKQEWESTFDSIPDLICILDADHNVIRLNRAMADAIGQPPAALVGKKCYQLLHDTDGPLATCPLEASDCAAAANEITRCGSVYEITISPLINNSRTSGRYVHVARNVTAVKVAEAEQKRLKEKAEMSSRLAAVGEMAAGIAHEINNPLTGVLGFSELLLQEDLPPDTKEQLKIIADGSKRVAEIVRRMLTFARQTTPIKKHVDIHELIDTTIDLRSYVLRTSGIEVVKNYHADISGISVDPSQIQQVFLNLLINAEYAIKQSNSPGVITINTETDDTFLRVVLSDNGPGIPVEVMNKLFQPFFTTKDPGQGTGLGLSLSRAIIVEHGGRLDVESPPGQGARFTIELPLTRSEDVIIPTASIAVPAVSVSRTVDILVIDDEECVRGVIRGILSQPNRLLDAAASAVEALRLMKKKHYDVIIMDLRMPGTSGITLFDDILALQPGARFRTIVVTGDVLDSRVKAFITDNGLDSLVKPFEPAELAQAVEKVLRRIGVSVHNY
jgi:PAS domain S-box-containing protein